SACASGYAHCSSRPDEGCEASLLDARSCGSCGTACPDSTPICSTGNGSARCGTSCAGSVPDSCAGTCVNLKADAKNCGSCGHDCSALPNVRAGAPAIQCVSGVCSIPPGACAAGFAHCSSRADDGCETDTTRPDNCGQCNKKCTAPTAL